MKIEALKSNRFNELLNSANYIKCFLTTGFVCLAYSNEAVSVSAFE